MLLKGDCLVTLKSLPDNSVDSVITDPPYELGFMGKSWDSTGIAYNVEVWLECLRVLKPGGHLLAFGGTRTYHRIAVAIEDAGFEIRDSIHWTYGSGFPKSMDVSKAIDKQRDDKDETLFVTRWLNQKKAESGLTNAQLLEVFGFKEGSGQIGHWTALTIGAQPTVPTLDQIPVLLKALRVEEKDVPPEIGELIWTLNGNKGKPGPNWFKREVVGSDTKARSTTGKSALPSVGGETVYETWDVTAPATDEAKKWMGWGTALKPSHEPIIVARKPLEGTVARNVLAWGVGGINIDATRVGTEVVVTTNGKGFNGSFEGGTNNNGGAEHTGRFPANTLFTHAPDCQKVGEDSEIVGGGAKASSGFVNGYEGDGFVGQNITTEVWECVDGCPVKLLDEQSGIRSGGHWGQVKMHGFGKFGTGDYTYDGVGRKSEKGGASRYFTQTQYDDEVDFPPFVYMAKASKADKNAGLGKLSGKEVHRYGAGIGEGKDPDAPVIEKNFHPTVKPVALMQYLIKLVTPFGGKVLDPFLGSGTTAVAAILEGCEWVGCELTADYWPIIEARTTWAKEKVGTNATLF